MHFCWKSKGLITKKSIRLPSCHGIHSKLYHLCFKNVVRMICTRLMVSGRTACTLKGIKNLWFAQGFCDSATWGVKHGNIRVPCGFGGVRAPTFRSRGDFAQNVTIPALKCCSKWLAGQKLKGFAFHTIGNILKPIGLRNDSARVRPESGVHKHT